MDFTIAITMGDPSGVGPEVIVRGLALREAREGTLPFVVGDAAVMRRAVELLSARVEVIEIADPGDASPSLGVIPVLPVSRLDPEKTPFGAPTEKGSRAALLAIETAVKTCLEGRAQAMVTAPINKEAMSRVGFSFPGHTEFLASLTGAKSHVMLMAGPRLMVALVTIHIPLARVAGAISLEAVLDTIRVTWEGLFRYFGHDRPRIAVAGLTPHAGEHGLFGHEEETIAEAVKRARTEGWDVLGPLPPDTVFFRAAQGDFDAVVAMYHDQGLIPFKLIHFYDGVNVTLGLPIIRTSVDHGTAYDIAGKGLARESSFAAALQLARKMAENAGEP